MNKKELGGAFLIALMAGVSGYHLHARQNASASRLQVETVPPKEYFVTQASFSEVENAKAVLEGLCAMVRTELQAKRVVDRRAIACDRSADPLAEPHLTNAIVDLEQAMSEFAGTDQELYLAQDLLRALKKANRFGCWVDVYLKGLYEHPTHPVVANFAQEALVVARRCGREDDVLAGFKHLQAISLDFPGKGTVEILLAGADARNQLARNDRLGSEPGRN